MVEHVRGIELFHVVQVLSYNPHPVPGVGTEIKCGTAHNPLFGYYETPMTFEVRMLDGTRRLFGAIHWLEQVEAGNVNPDNFPVAARAIAKHYQMMSRELIMENVRREVSPKAPSRLSCLWASDSLDQANRWFDRLEGRSILVRLEATGTILRADANLLSRGAEAYSAMVADSERYWRGEMSATPDRETLLSGTATVIEVVRGV